MATVSFVGRELVPAKLCSVIERIMAGPEWEKNYTILFLEDIVDNPRLLDEDGKPLPIFGRWIPCINTIAVSISENFSWALNQAITNNNAISLRAGLWYTLLNTIAHELKHSTQVNPDTPKAEDAAESYAAEAPWRWSKELDLEVPQNWGPYLTKELQEIEGGWRKDSTNPWEQTQVVCLERGFVWYDSATGAFKTSFRLIGKDCLDDGDPKWDIAPQPIEEEATPIRWKELKAEAVVAPPPAAPVIAPAAPAAQFNNLYPPKGMEMNTAVNPTGPVSPITPKASAAPAMAPLPPPQAPAPFQPFTQPWINPFCAEEFDNTALNLLYEEDGDFTPAPPAPPTSAANQWAQRSPDTPAPQEAPPPPVAVERAGMPKTNSFVELLTRIHNHIYDKCGWNPQEDKVFSSPAHVIEPIYIGDIPGIRDMLVGFDGVDSYGRPVYFRGAGSLEIVDMLGRGVINGTTTAKLGFPKYTLYLNKGGTLVTLTVLPQNPNKLNKNTGHLSPWATEAKGGVKITVVMKEKEGVSSFIKQGPGGPPVWGKF